MVFNHKTQLPKNETNFIPNPTFRQCYFVHLSFFQGFVYMQYNLILIFFPKYLYRMDISLIDFWANTHDRNWKAYHGGQNI